MNTILRNTMKSKALFPIIVAIATMCLCILCCNYVSQTAANTVRTMLSDGQWAASASVQTPMWTLREYKGKIGVFDSTGALSDTLEVSVASLPQTDRQYLTEGIPVYSVTELLSRIEDYTG